MSHLYVTWLKKDMSSCAVEDMRRLLHTCHHLFTCVCVMTHSQVPWLICTWQRLVFEQDLEFVCSRQCGSTPSHMTKLIHFLPLLNHMCNNLFKCAMTHSNVTTLILKKDLQIICSGVRQALVLLEKPLVRFWRNRIIGLTVFRWVLCYYHLYIHVCILED